MLWTIIVTALVTLLLTALAMNFSTAEKEIERKIEHRYGITDPQFRREMSLMMGPAIVGGNRIEALQNGEEIFPAMLDAIKTAETSITFETYIYWGGDVGRRFCEAVSERAGRGVRVHITLDWAGSVKMDDHLLERMESAGVRVQRYRPLHWYNIGRMNYRTHRKLLIVDGRIGFTGGVGIADQWQGHADTPDHWRDMHFRVHGPVVAQLQAAYNDNWIKTTGELLNGDQFFPALSDQGSHDAHMFIASPASGSQSMHLMFLLAFSAAEHSIDIAASYFVPDTLLIQALISAATRSVRVRVLVPGPHIDSFTVKIATKAAWGELLRAGIEIFVYQPTMLHVKLLVIDREFVSVGSTNLDMRSLRLNDEASMNVYDREFAAQMTSVYEKDLESAKKYDYAAWERRTLREKLMETLLLPIKSQL